MLDMFEQKFSIGAVHEEDGVAFTNFIAIEHSHITILQGIDQLIRDVDHQVKIFIT